MRERLLSKWERELAEREDRDKGKEGGERKGGGRGGRERQEWGERYGERERE
jgi:hypothetical protein